MSGIWVSIIMLGLVAGLGYILVVAVRLEAQAELLQDEDRLDVIAAIHNANAHARRNQAFDRYDERPFALDDSPRRVS